MAFGIAATLAAVISLCVGQQPASAASVVYTYDLLGRVTTALYDDGTCVVYSYDAAGNRTSQTNTTGGAPTTATWGTGTWGCFQWTGGTTQLSPRRRAYAGAAPFGPGLLPSPHAPQEAESRRFVSIADIPRERGR